MHRFVWLGWKVLVGNETVGRQRRHIADTIRVMRPLEAIMRGQTPKLRGSRSHHPDRQLSSGSDVLGADVSNRFWPEGAIRGLLGNGSYRTFAACKPTVGNRPNCCPKKAITYDLDFYASSGKKTGRGEPNRHTNPW